MDFEQLFSNISSLSNAVGLLTVVALKSKKAGRYVSALLFGSALIFKALEIQYDCSTADILIIALGVLIIFMNGFLAGREKERESTNEV